MCYAVFALWLARWLALGFGLGLPACTRKPVPKLQIEVTFLGNADLGRLSRVAELQYTSRQESGFIFRHHETQRKLLPVVVDGNRLQLTVPKYNDDEYDLTYVAVPFQTDLDRRVGVAASRLSFIPTADMMPSVWREDNGSGDSRGVGYYFEQTADGVFRSRRYFLGEFAEFIEPDDSMVYFSALEQTQRVEVTLDFRPLPYFVDVRRVPPDELSPPLDAAASNAPTQTEGLRFEVADFELLEGAPIHVAAVDPKLKLPFWDGERGYPFATNWSVMRVSDFTALQDAPLHRRAQLTVTQQTWSAAPSNARLPKAGHGQIEWRYVEGQQPTSFVLGVEHDGLVFVRRAP